VMIVPSLSDPAKGLRGWHVAAGVCAFFAVVITVDTTFAVMAVKTHPGEVSVTPYEDGLIYDKHIAQLDAQERLGWKAYASAGRGFVALRFEDRSGAPVRGLAVAGRLERPATESGRIVLKFIEAAPGRYEAQTGPLAGSWDLTAEAHAAGGGSFIATRRLAT
jgi:nitrogen fixation protein FixH